MESGIVTLDENKTAPAVVVGSADGGRVVLLVFLETGPIRYVAERGDAPGVGVFVADA